MTTLQTIPAIVNGTKTTVEQVYLSGHRLGNQDIRYRVGRRLLKADKFFAIGKLIR